MNKEELVSLDYETECNRLKQKLNEQADEWAKKLDSIVYEKNMIIENQMKEIDKHEFYIFSKYFDEIVENKIKKKYHITLKEYFENVF